jgi:hypothetical protein
VRRSGDAGSVIKLYGDDREEVVQSGLAPAQAEDLCAPKNWRVRIATAPQIIRSPPSETAAAD